MEPISMVLTLVALRRIRRRQKKGTHCIIDLVMDETDKLYAYAKIAGSIQAVLTWQEHAPGILHNLIPTWPQFSGDIDFPVPSAKPNTAPEDAYRYAQSKGSLWRGNYGKLRYSLLDHCIEELWYLLDDGFQNHDYAEIRHIWPITSSHH